MKYTKEQLIDALVAEWDYLCHDDYDPDDDTPEEYRLKMELLTVEELVEETSTGEGYTLDEFMENWLWQWLDTLLVYNNHVQQLHLLFWWSHSHARVLW